MNNIKKTFNPLSGHMFRYEQPESVSVKYSGNWNIMGQDVASSAWSVVNGSATLSSEALSSNITSVLITGDPGENTILNTVTLTDGQTASRLIKLKITDNDDPNLNEDYDYVC